jgi:hypothetical protein
VSDKWKCDVGKGWGYSTRPAGLTTYLMIQPWFDDKGMCSDTTCTWHIELCKESDHDQKVTSNDNTLKVDISAAGAIVNVRNTGGWPFNVWTDY